VLDKLSSAVDLPSGPFRLTGVDLQKCEKLRSDDFQRLAGLPALFALHIADANRDPSVLDWLGQCPQLKHLNMQRASVQTSELIRLRHLPGLHTIDLDSRQIDDDWAFLEQLTSIRELRLWGGQLPPGLDQLRKSPRLQTLQIGTAATLSEADVQTIQSACPNVRIILLDESRVVGDDPVARAVRELTARGAIIEAQTFDGKLATLSDADVAGVRYVLGLTLPRAATLTDQELRLIPLLSANLYRVKAEGIEDADGFVEGMVEARVGNSFSLSESGLTDVGLASLSRHPHVSTLNVKQTHVTRAGIEAFKRRVPTCVVVSDFGTFEYEHKLPEGWEGANRTRAADEGK
jgi:hypothetical protein